MDYVVMDKKSVFIDKYSKIGKNVIIYENNRIDGNSEICDNVTIFPNSFITNSIIGKGTKIYSSVIENSKIGSCCYIGPFCHIKRAVIPKNSKFGAFSKVYNNHDRRTD